MRKIFEDIFTKNLPTLDLHGYDRYTADVAVNEFILDNFKLGYHDVVIIHGVGTGVIKQAVHNNLKNNKNVLEYKFHNFNIGMTIVKIR
ncbi:MAG: Smr/MutS family protein [Bacilli bacterium]|nr:Smr/MutS family protein [Bacilli bacterium]MDD4053491.1 Smr/MutS family protein [Bacilli bacterium]MDD4411526.1 Smr/MutS family protein [Bacilli bacterium]